MALNRYRKLHRALLLLAALGASSRTLASGPEFQDALFSNRTGFLLTTPESGVPPLLPGRATDGLVARFPDMTPADVPAAEALRRERQSAESTNASAGIAAKIASMRAARDGDAAWLLGGDLPIAIRLYTAAAVDFDLGAPLIAEPRFAAILQLPTADAAPRATWAAYMLGRIKAARHDDSGAEAAFTAVRTLALAGAPDPLGLAVASFGQQARLRLDRHDIVGAIALYTSQWAHGDATAEQSLDFTARSAFRHPETWPASLADPVSRAMLIHAMLRQSGDEDVDPPLKNFYERVAETGRPEDPNDVLAAMAYRTGDFARADVFAQRAPAQFSLWLRAKLALQKGDDARAAALFSQALRSSHANAPGIDSLRIDNGAMQVRRGDFILALQSLWAGTQTSGGDYYVDVMYLAERIVTTDELKRFVDSYVALPIIGSNSHDGAIRDVLAARLMREAKIDAALPYFTQASIREKAIIYQQMLQQTKAASGIHKAAILWQQAKLLRYWGMEMMGTTLWPDDAGDGGLYDSPIGFYSDPFTHKAGEYVPEERARFDASAPVPDKRFHYRYLAVDEAGLAVSLVPARSQAAAAMLCQAADWMRATRDEGAYRALWRRYLQNGAFVPFAKTFGHSCPDPDFAGAHMTSRKLFFINARDFIHICKIPLAALALAMGAVAVWVVKRRHQV